MACKPYIVKIKEPQMKQWAFLGCGGLLTDRAHATPAPKAQARDIAARLAARYPDTRAKAVRW
jgi:hypothetical protein